jgi:hypothetical protein
MTHPNSIAAYRSSKFGKRCQDILDSIRRDGPGTCREIAERLGYADMNKVRPRVNDMMYPDDGTRPLLIDIGERTCRVTGKTVMVVGLAKESASDALLSALRAGATQPGLFDALVEMTKPRYGEWPK